MERHTYRYPLEPVLTRQRWELDRRSTELHAAARHLRDCERAVQVVDAELAETCRAIERSRTGDTLDLARETALRRYAERLALRRQHALGARQEAQALHDRAAAAVRQALRNVHGMERHRARQQHEHAVAFAAAQGRHADDQWLLAHAAKEGTP